jgi:hypothetical protein
MIDEDECVAEFVDGNWTTHLCGCADCLTITAETEDLYGIEG